MTDPLPILARMPGGGKLKITGCKTLLVNNVEPYWGHEKWLFVQLITNEGIVGLGERPAAGAINPKPQIELIQDLAERFVVGQSPFDIKKIWLNAYTAAHDYRHPGLYGTPALSALEMACWDVIGKATGQPVYNLLGGRFHERLRAYRYLDMVGVWENPPLAGERAVRMLESGITACKLDPFDGDAFNAASVGGARDFPLETLRRVARIFRQIRDAVGDAMEIGIGTHGQFSTAGAIRVASLLEEFNPFFFEEPVPPENATEMARIAAHTKIPIATGERLITKYEFAEVLEKRAAQVIQLDVGQCGGVLESREIAAMAEAHYATIAPHMFCGPVAVAASIHLDTCCPNFLAQEYNTTALHDDLLKEPLKLERGFLIPPTGPGFGIEFNERVLARQLAT